MTEILGSGLPLNSWHFLALSILAIVLCRAIKLPGTRSGLLALLNIYFIAHFVRDARSAMFLLIVLASIYVIGRFRKNTTGKWASVSQVVVVVGIWGTLFLAKDPQLIPQANPFFYFPVQVIGLSYLMFRGISYVMEVNLSGDRSPLSYLNYMLFFPMILAGPIERYQAFQKQLPVAPDEDDPILPALHRIANGFIKKFVLADNLSSLGILSVSTMPDASVPLLWLGALSQLFLVYLDFSGYCDIVIGVAMLMGFKLRENFNRPFLSTNIQVFWERWHISLGQLLRDYVFNPLVKFSIQRFPRKLHFPLFVFVYFLTMVLVALWHGTTWGFLVFGLFHGLALVAYQIKQKWGRKSRTRHQPEPTVAFQLSTLCARVGTYAFVSISLMLWMGSERDWATMFGRMVGYLP